MRYCRCSNDQLIRYGKRMIKMYEVCMSLGVFSVVLDSTLSVLRLQPWAMSIVKQASSNQGQIRAYTMNLGLKHLEMDWLLTMYVSEKQMIQMFPFHDFQKCKKSKKSTWSKVVQLTRISQSATAFPATLDQRLDCTSRNFFAKKQTCNHDYD